MNTLKLTSKPNITFSVNGPDSDEAIYAEFTLDLEPLRASALTDGDVRKNLYLVTDNQQSIMLDDVQMLINSDMQVTTLYVTLNQPISEEQIRNAQFTYYGIDMDDLKRYQRTKCPVLRQNLMMGLQHGFTALFSLEEGTDQYYYVDRALKQRCVILGICYVAWKEKYKELHLKHLGEL